MFDFPLGPTVPLAPPLYPSSVYNIPDLDALDRISDGTDPGFIYARDGHPNAKLLADQLATLEGGAWAVVCGSGMGAITAAFLAFVSAGDRIVASNRLYGRTSKFLNQQISRFGVRTDLVDCNDLAAVRAALATPAKVLFVETISNPLCRTVDLPALADLAHAAGTKLVVDNTFATPVLCRPLEHGADLVMESLTKLIGGHSDLTLGSLAGRGGDLFPRLTDLISTWGLFANPFDCWMCTRGLATLDLRVTAAADNALAVASWLADQPGVTRVVYPGRPDQPDHDLTGRLLGGRFGNMLCFELAGGRAAVNAFVRAAPAIPLSPSLGHVTTTLSYPWATSHRYDSPEAKTRQGITEGLIRLSVGIEPAERIRAEMARGLAAATLR
jgi:cystathionine gamma-synthase